MQVSYSSDGPGMKNIMAGIAALNGADALVGIPEGDDRQLDLLLRALLLLIKISKKGNKMNKRVKKLVEASSQPISNAELLFIFTNGSPLRGQPARPVIEPAIEQPKTAERIARALAAASIAALDGNKEGMMDALDRAGTIGESAAKRWFTDSRNGWEPNAPSTIRAKGSETPGIDTGQMRRAITHVVEASQGVHEGNATNFSPDTEIAFGPQSEGAIEEVAEVAAV
jgi:hypothetical protein